jgi:hypothetical protein
MTPDAGSILDAAAVLRELLRPIQARLEHLEQITKALEQREDAGVWQPGVSYPKYAGVTHAGHYWIASERTKDQPGEGNPAWRLAVRRGKTGREGKRGPACRCAELTDQDIHEVREERR